MQRAEIITVERRRRWSLSDKQQIVAETLQPGASVSTIAQRYGMHPSQLFACVNGGAIFLSLGEVNFPRCRGGDQAIADWVA
jgi:hypothetical protein